MKTTEVLVLEQALSDSYEEMTGSPLPEDYAKEYGRPSLTEVPYMRSENDGLPYIPSHSPACDGKRHYSRGRCWCEWIGYRSK